MQSLTEISLGAFGIMFQEYEVGKYKRASVRFSQLRVLWIVLTMFLTMAFVGNLKSSLVRKELEQRTMTFDEMVDKDMYIHTNSILMQWYDHPLGKLTPLHARLKCQALKKKSVFVPVQRYSDTCKLRLQLSNNF